LFILLFTDVLLWLMVLSVMYHGLPMGTNGGRRLQPCLPTILCGCLRISECNKHDLPSVQLPTFDILITGSNPTKRAGFLLTSSYSNSRHC
jgi:hypothetical protein